MTYAETTKILSKQIKLLIEESEKYFCDFDHYNIFVRFCSEINEISKLLVYALSYSGATKNHDELSEIVELLDKQACLISERYDDKKNVRVPAFLDANNKAFRLIIQASAMIKHLLTSVSNFQNRYDGEDL